MLSWDSITVEPFCRTLLIKSWTISSAFLGHRIARLFNDAFFKRRDRFQFLADTDQNFVPGHQISDINWARFGTRFSKHGDDIALFVELDCVRDMLWPRELLEQSAVAQQKEYAIENIGPMVFPQKINAGVVRPGEEDTAPPNLRH